MNEEKMNIIKLGVWVLLAVSAFLYATQYARSVDRSYPTRVFSVDGTGEIEVKPDVAQFSATVISEGNDVVALQNENNEKMNRITAFVKEQGVEEADIKTAQYNLAPRYSSVPCQPGAAVCPPSSISGYTLHQTLEVKVRDASRVGALLTGVVENGANSVSEVRFVVDDDEAAKNEARSEAISKAQEKAMTLAEAGGFRIGELVSIYESSSQPMPYGMGGDAMSASVAREQANIQPGTQETTVQVTLTYEIIN
jgi:uncharacterized protein YggE